MELKAGDFDPNILEIVAHARKNGDRTWGPPHMLIEHLLSTGNLAQEFSEKFHSGEVGRTLGLLHESHPVGMCGLKLLYIPFSLVIVQSHPVGMCGLKQGQD